MKHGNLLLSAASHIDVTLSGTWSGDSKAAIYNSTAFGAGTLVASNSGTPAVLSQNLAAGTYYLMVGSATNGRTGTYTLSSSQELTPYDSRNTTNPSVLPGTHNGNPLTPPGFPAIGSIAQAQVQVRVDKSARSGIVQQTFNKVRWGFTFYNSATNNNVGKILVGCENTDLNTFLNAFNTIYPYWGTPTGEALEEALDYFKQNNGHSNAVNSTYVTGLGSAKDPYYQKDINNVLVAVPCRKSYVVLISDGDWNGSVDPVIPARELHAQDLRTEATPTDPTSDPPNQPAFREVQSVDVYSIFAFGTTSEQGKNAMKAIGMFGGFTGDSSCGSTTWNTNWPYNLSAYPASSLTMTWPLTNCNPGGTYNTCCKEWDLNWDRYTSGDNLDKGVPDNYFEASEGQDLQAALLRVLSSSIVRNATASAVATVAQQTQAGDIIIRGLFHSSDPETPGRYLWRGHLEAYWPVLNETDGKFHYDFETNPPCFEMTGTRHCWDGAEILRNGTPVGTDDRNIYYWDSTATPKTQPFPKHGDIDSTTDPTEIAKRNLWKTKLGLAATPTADDLVDWVRGTDVGTLRDRDRWGLGDIVYSTPVVVGTPSVGAVSTHDPDRQAFYDYRNNVFYRDQVAYVGANDGMVHAFLMARWDASKEIWLNKKGDTSSDPSNPNYDADPEIGKELWAYMPSNLLTELQYGANTQYGATGCVHRTMVDLAPQSWEVYIKPQTAPDGTVPTCPDGAGGRCWRTVILGGERGGGDVYFAIDVTDPSTPTVLWEYSMFMNRIIYDRTGNRSLSQCYSNPAGNSGTNCKPANLNTCVDVCRHISDTECRLPYSSNISIAVEDTSHSLVAAGCGETENTDRAACLHW